MKADLGIDHGSVPLTEKQEKQLLREGIQEQLRKVHEDMMLDDDGAGENAQAPR